MAKKRQTAAEYIEANAMLVPMILGDMAEHLGKAAQEWSSAVWAARSGDLDKGPNACGRGGNRRGRPTPGGQIRTSIDHRTRWESAGR